MKKSSFLWVFIMLMLAISMSSCSSDDGQVEDNLLDDMVDIYDPNFKVSYYNQDPGLQFRQNHWVNGHCHEMIPQKEPPYILLVNWDSDKGKEALDYITNKGDGVVISRNDFGHENTSLIVCNKFILCPYLYISSSYKSSDEYLLENEYIRIGSLILLKMKEGQSVEAITRDYADFLELYHNNKLYGVYAFRCTLRFSCQVLQLAETLHLREDVEWAEPDMWLPSL